jgi:hypothetical protein
MKVQKTVSDKLFKANRENGALSNGPKTLIGKSWSRRNALKHGILAKSLVSKDEEERAAFNSFLERLQQDQQPRNFLELMVVEELATSHVRRARPLKLEQRLYRKSSPATQIFLKAVGANSDLLGVADGELPEDCRGWDCQEVSITGKKGPVDATKFSSDRQQHFTVQARCASPMDIAQRYQSATRRDFYRASNQLLSMRKQRDQEGGVVQKTKYQTNPLSLLFSKNAGAGPRSLVALPT